MPSRTDSPTRGPLEPLREALLQAARDEAAHLLAQAAEKADLIESRARVQAERLREEARAKGSADAAQLVAAHRSRAGREARAVVLAAHRAEYDALREAARSAVAELRREPDYSLVRRRMVDALRELLGADASIADVPGGGVAGTAPGRRADFSLVRLADQAVDAVLAEESYQDTLGGDGVMTEPAAGEHPSEHASGRGGGPR